MVIIIVICFCYVILCFFLVQIFIDFNAKNKGGPTGKAGGRKTMRRRSFEGGDLNSAHDKANMFGNMVCT